MGDWRSAPVSERIKAALAFAVKLTITPRVMGEADVENLRRAGYNDMEIAEIVLVTAHFNFMNRVGMALGKSLLGRRAQRQDVEQAVSPA